MAGFKGTQTTDVLTAFKVDLGKGELVKVEEVQLGKNPIRLLAVTLPGTQ